MAQILRGTKIVRSIATTPKRGGGGSGSIAEGWGKAPLEAAERLPGSGGVHFSSGGGASNGGNINGGNVNGGNNNNNNNNRNNSNGGSAAGKMKNRSSIVAHVPAETLCSNPLKPCGACMEWLKKIAEVNPDFKVITFTDSRCGGVYIEDVAQIP